MGCSTLDVDEEDSTVDIRDWNLPDPHEEDIDTVRSIRDEIYQRVVDLFDELSDDSHLSATAN
jgi:arsenate reductase